MSETEIIQDFINDLHAIHIKNDAIAFKHTIKAIRTHLLLSQVDFAKGLKVNSATVLNWEKKGNYYPSTLKKVITYLEGKLI